MTEPLQPTHDRRSSLSDLVEVLLNRGVLLNLDLVIAVADIPLIGISLKAAVAGIETMLEYGMMRDWDAQTRAWVQRSITRDVEFEADEKLVVRMAGEYQEPEPFRTWRPGTLYLTDRRLFLFRRDLRKILWTAEREDIAGAAIEYDTGLTGEPLARVRLDTTHQASVRLIAARPERLIELLGEAAPHPASAPVFEGQLWYLEPRASGSVWRGGQGRVETATFTWKSPLDARPAAILHLAGISSITRVPARTPAGAMALEVRTVTGEVILLAASDPLRWFEVLNPETKVVRDGTDG